MSFNRSNTSRRNENSNVIQMPLRLGGANAPRVDISMLKIIGSTFDVMPHNAAIDSNFVSENQTGQIA